PRPVLARVASRRFSVLRRWVESWSRRPAGRAERRPVVVSRFADLRVCGRGRGQPPAPYPRCSMSTRKSNRFAPLLADLEDRTGPAGYPPPAGATLVSPDDGGIPRVKVIDPATGEDIAEVQAYEDAFRGGVRAALGDVTGDGVDDLVIAP